MKGPHPTVRSFREACPFLKSPLFDNDLELPTAYFGHVALGLIEGRWSTPEEQQIFAYFNDVAESEDLEVVTTLKTGAIELLNDSASAQRIARANLKGKALQFLEECRLFFGQPDYGVVPDE